MGPLARDRHRRALVFARGALILAFVVLAAIVTNEWFGGPIIELTLLPATKVAAEDRFEDVADDTGGATEDKDSHFLLVGIDYTSGPKLTASARVGAEFRSRSGEAGADLPYLELSAQYDYGENHFLSPGSVSIREETANVALYTDSQAHRVFTNVQPAVTPSRAGSVNFEPSTRKSRRGISADRDETTVRFGLALTGVAQRNGSVSATVDMDDVSSDDVARGLGRSRCGVSARYPF